MRKKKEKRWKEEGGFGRRWVTSMSLRSAWKEGAGPWSLPSTLSPGQLRSCSTRRFTFVPDGNGNVSKTPSLNLFNHPRFPRVATPFWSSRVSPNLSMGAWILNGKRLERRVGYLFVHKDARWVISNERTNERTTLTMKWEFQKDMISSILVEYLSPDFKRRERKGFFFFSYRERKKNKTFKLEIMLEYVYAKW